MATVKDLMTKNVVTVDANKIVVEAAVLMSEKDIGDLVVIDGNTPVGIITERDFVRRVLAEWLSRLASLREREKKENAGDTLFSAVILRREKKRFFVCVLC